MTIKGVNFIPRRLLSNFRSILLDVEMKFREFVNQKERAVVVYTDDGASPKLMF